MYVNPARVSSTSSRSSVLSPSSRAAYEVADASLLVLWLGVKLTYG